MLKEFDLFKTKNSKLPYFLDWLQYSFGVPFWFYIVLFLVFLGLVGSFTILLQTFINAKNNPTKINVCQFFNYLIYFFTIIICFKSLR